MAGIPKLIILSEQFRGRTFELTKDQHTVGRVDERDICIKDPTISTYHCRFIKSGNTYAVEDQGSTNGTRVNNVPITSQVVLQNSDILQIGGVELLYDCDDKSVTTVVQQQTTEIDVNAASTTQTIRRVDEMGFTKRNKGNSGQKVMIGLIALLALLVLGLLAFLLVTLTSEKGNPAGQNPMPGNPVSATVETMAPLPAAPAQPVQPAAAPAAPAPAQPAAQPAQPAAQPAQPAAAPAAPAPAQPAAAPAQA